MSIKPANIFTTGVKVINNFREIVQTVSTDIQSMASTEAQRIPTRERRPSTSAPIVDIQGSVSPAGISRPKHKRTFTGFGAGDIKTVEGGEISNPCPGTTTL